MKDITWGFVIDTNSYSGNFERELGTFATGYVGDYGYPQYLDEDENYAIFDGAFKELLNDHDYRSAVAIYPTAGMYNSGMGTHYKKGEEEQALVDYRKAVRKHTEPQIARRNEILEKLQKGVKVSDWTEDAVHRENAYDLKRIADADALTVDQLAKYPAYQSVVIYFKERPTDEQIEFIKRKAKEFNYADVFRPDATKFEVTGFRIITITKSEEVVQEVVCQY